MGEEGEHSRGIRDNAVPTLPDDTLSIRVWGRSCVYLL